MADIAADASRPWYSTLNRSQWNTLFASNLGWMFDGYETYALILTIGAALHQLLDPSQYAAIPKYAGIVIGLTLLGWGIGGMIGGILADYIGRKRTMMVAILAYSLMTGLSAFAWNWESFAAARLIVGIAIGSEWATGASIVAELWPDRARGRGAGLMQCGLGIGFFVASLVWLFVGKMGPDAWRYMYFIGILPGFFTLWIRKGIPESPKWEQAAAQRRAAKERHERTRFTLVELFATPGLARVTFFAFVLSLTTTLTWWGISAWLPPYVASVAAKAGLPGPVWASYAGMAYNIGAIAGYIGLGFFADMYGRKPVTLVYIVVAFLTTPLFLDAGLAAGALPDAHARDRGGFRLQHAALHRLAGTDHRRNAGRELRRLQQRGDGDGHDLCPRPPQRAVPSRDAGQAAARRDREVAHAEDRPHHRRGQRLRPRRRHRARRPRA
jgi:MFS family permease